MWCDPLVQQVENCDQCNVSYLPGLHSCTFVGLEPTARQALYRDVKYDEDANAASLDMCDSSIGNELVD